MLLGFGCHFDVTTAASIKMYPDWVDNLESSLIRVVKYRLDCPTQRELHHQQI